MCLRCDTRVCLKKNLNASRPSEHPIQGNFFKTLLLSLTFNVLFEKNYSYPLPPKPDSGYECGRVFPVGVGPGSPSRDAANWLPSRFGRSVETRRQYGWLRMVSWGGWRHARGREHCRGEPAGSLSGGYAPDSAKAEGSSIVDEPGEG